MSSNLERLYPAVIFAAFTVLMTVPGIAALPSTSIVTDPNTGLPAESWKDPNWKEPEKVLAQVSWDGLPLGEVIRDLCDRFTNAFDVITPSEWKDPKDPQRFAGAPLDPQATPIKMMLRNVTASEVFNAMNLMFEAENSPLRWKLIMNGNRPAVLLRFLPVLLPHPAPPDQSRRMVFFVGDLLGDEKSGGMTIDQLLDTIRDVYRMSLGEPRDAIKFHKGAQLLIVTGTVDQTEFIQQTIAALQKKAHQLPMPRRFSSGEVQPHDPQPKTPEPREKAKETQAP